MLGSGLGLGLGLQGYLAESDGGGRRVVGGHCPVTTEVEDELAGLWASGVVGSARKGELESSLVVKREK